MGHTASKIISILVKPCSICIGKLPSIFYNKIKDVDRHELSISINSLSQPGDFILSHIDNRPTNLFLGGSPYTHLGIINGDGYVIDMVSKGASKTPIADWLSGKDRILIVRASILDTNQQNLIVKYAEKCYIQKTPYDFSFEVGSDAIYCTELAYLALRSIDTRLPFKLGLIPTVGGLLQSTTYRANSFIQSLEYGKIIPVLEWRYEDGLSTSVNINRLLDSTINPSSTNDKSQVLFELTKLAYPFNKDRILLIQENRSIKKSCLPTRHLRINRQKYNKIPINDLYEIEEGDFPFRVFQDRKTLEIYVTVSQSKNLLHCPCKWTKLVSFDAVHGIPEALGSIEILVENSVLSNSVIPRESIHPGSYNYRDMYVAGRYDHWCLDIFGCCKS